MKVYALSTLIIWLETASRYLHLGIEWYYVEGRVLVNSCDWYELATGGTPFHYEHFKFEWSHEGSSR